MAFLLLVVTFLGLASPIVPVGLSNDLAEFKRVSDVIVANRVTDDIADVVNKVYTRDLFGKD